MLSYQASQTSATEVNYGGSLRRAKVPVVHLAVSRQRWEQAIADSTDTESATSRWRSALFTVAVGLAGIIIAQSVIIGEIAIVLYGIYALIKRIPSVVTFKLALLGLIATVAAMLIHHTVSAANTFATYTFLLMVVGVLSLLRELPGEEYKKV